MNVLVDLRIQRFRNNAYFHGRAVKNMEERLDLWQPRLPRNKDEKKMPYHQLLHFVGFAICYFLVSGLYSIIEWLSAMQGSEIIPDNPPWWSIFMATIVIYPLLCTAYKENLEQQENGSS